MTSGNGMIDSAMPTNLDTPHDDEMLCDAKGCKNDWGIILRVGPVGNEYKLQLCSECLYREVGEAVVDHSATLDRLGPNHYRLVYPIGAPQCGSGELWDKFVKASQ